MPGLSSYAQQPFGGYSVASLRRSSSRSEWPGRPTTNAVDPAEGLHRQPLLSSERMHSMAEAMMRPCHSGKPPRPGSLLLNRHLRAPICFERVRASVVIRRSRWQRPTLARLVALLSELRQRPCITTLSIHSMHLLLVGKEVSASHLLLKAGGGIVPVCPALSKRHRCDPS